jgi:hypothetical protein
MSSAEDLSVSRDVPAAECTGSGQFLRAETVRHIQTGGAPSDGFSYAFGWREGRIGGTRAVHHGGIVPDFRCKLVMLPDSGWGVVVLTNVSSAIPWPLTPTSHRLADDIAARLVGQPLPPAESRHQVTFALIAAGIGILLLMQRRPLEREARLARRPSSSSGVSGRVGEQVIDVLFLIGIVLLPGLVGLRWADLFGAARLAWWLVAMGAQGDDAWLSSGSAETARRRDLTNDGPGRNTSRNPCQTRSCQHSNLPHLLPIARLEVSGFRLSA